MLKSFITKNVKSLAGITALASLLVGIVLLPFGIASTIHDQNFRNHARSTRSISISQVPVQNTRGATNIRFRYVVNGRTYTAEEAGPDYSENLTNQTVLYNPANPSQAILANANVGNSVMALGLSIFFLLLGVVLLVLKRLWRYWRRQRIGYN